MKNKISIQYWVTNVKLRDEVFYNWLEFDKKLSGGLEIMKDYLLGLWDECKNRLQQNPDLEITDLDKVVKKEDFNVTINYTKKKTPVFFITFPDHQFKDAASKYIALALCQKNPRYFTMEYANTIEPNQERFVIGEFVPVDNTNCRHINYGFFDNNRLTFFAGYILGLLDEYEAQEVVE